MCTAISVSFSPLKRYFLFSRTIAIDLCSGSISSWLWRSSCANCFSFVRLFATPWTVARQAPLSMGFSRQDVPQGIFLTQGSNPSLLHRRYWQVASLSHILSNTFWLFSYEFHHFLLGDKYCPQFLRPPYFDSVLSLIFSLFLLSSFLMSNLHPLPVSSTPIVEYYWHWFSFFSKTLSYLPRRPLGRRSRQPSFKTEATWHSCMQEDHLWTFAMILAICHKFCR